MNPKSLFPDRPLHGLGRALESLRKQRGWSRSELARAAGLSPDTVSRCEKDDAYPSTRVLESLLAALGAHLGDLFGAQVAVWHEPLRLWPDAEVERSPDADKAPGSIAWLELRARVGRLHQQLERLQAAVYGESVAQTSRLVQSLTENSSEEGPRGELGRELAAAAERLRELHNLLQVEPKAALDLQAEYASPENGSEGGTQSAAGKSAAGKKERPRR